MNILGPRMGPSYVEMASEKPELSPLIPNMKADRGSNIKGQKVESQGRPLEKPSSFSEVLEQQNPRVENPGRVKTPERTSDIANERIPSEEKRPETDETIPEVAAKGGAPTKMIGNAKQKEAREEKAMLEFMDSMESEFGIPPTKIVEALAELKPSDLLKSPDQTASQVIKNLDLSPEDESRALMLYMSFLQQWKQTQQDPANFFATNPPLIVGSPELKGMQSPLPMAEQKKLLNESLDRMNDKFFLKDAVSRAQLAQARIEPGAAGLQPRELLSDGMFPVTSGMEVPATGEVLDPSRLEGLPMTANGEIDLSQLPPEALKGGSAYEKALAAQAANRASGSAMDPQVAAIEAQSLKDGTQVQKQQMLKPSDFFMTAQAPAAQALPAAHENAAAVSSMNVTDLVSLPTDSVAAANLNTGKDAGFMGGFGSENSSDMQSKGDSLGEKSLQVSGDQFFPRPAALGSPAMAVPTATTGKSNAADPNMQAIMNQAQLIVNRGGGEATLKLNPEGLGEVRLKVMVVNGRVNVEMAAQTREAKQLIESSIADLKSSLSSHRLAVDHIKVDVGNQAGTDLQQSNQRNMDAQAGFNRDQAQKFFNQFREDTASRRDPFYEMPGIRSYQRSLTPAPMAPATDRQVNRYVGQGRGERMNLVG